MTIFNDKLSAILGGGAIAAAIVITMPQAAVALSGQQINDIAREVTVLISSGSGGHGSGVIIAKDGNSYYVLTAHHVVDAGDNYKIVTHDRGVYETDRVKSLPGVDLAIVQFVSRKNYPIAELGSADPSQGQIVFVSGWPEPGATGQTIRQFTDGQISGFLDEPIEGYQLVYTNITRGGMSGGPIFDSGGRVIAIHGLGDREQPEKLMETEGITQDAAKRIASLIKPGFNYGIPIDTYLKLADRAGLDLNVKVNGSDAPELASGSTMAEPDRRDFIDDIDNILEDIGRFGDSIEQGKELLDRFRNLP